MTTIEDQVSDDEIRAMAFRVWSFKQGEQVSMLIHLGDRLGLFRALASAEWMTSAEVASRAGDFSERWVREWLHGMVGAGIADHADGTFRLGRAAQAVLVDEGESLFFAAGAFTGANPPDLLDDLADAFRTGIGLPYDRLGPSGAHRTERMLGPWARLALVPEILPRVPGLVDALTGGIRVADVGCGAGVALEALADAFPASTFDGYDLSRHAIDRANAKLGDRTSVTLHHARAEDLPIGAGYGLVLTFDCLHDMTRPDLALAAIRAAIADDGVLLVKEIRCAPTLDENLRNPMLAMMCGFSVLSCLSSATSEPGGMGLGTVGLHGERLEELAIAAGFTSVTQHDVGEPTNLYYEVRPT